MENKSKNLNELGKKPKKQKPPQWVSAAKMEKMNSLFQASLNVMSHEVSLICPQYSRQELLGSYIVAILARFFISSRQRCYKQAA